MKGPFQFQPVSFSFSHEKKNCELRNEEKRFKNFEGIHLSKGGGGEIAGDEKQVELSRGEGSGKKSEIAHPTVTSFKPKQRQSSGDLLALFHSISKQNIQIVYHTSRC